MRSETNQIIYEVIMSAANNKLCFVYKLVQEQVSMRLCITKEQSIF
jgi:hypothetical protein